MKRGGPLRRDPEKAREWRRRSGGLKRGGRLRRSVKKKPEEGPLTPGDWKLEVFAAERVRDRSRWGPNGEPRCPVTGDVLIFLEDDAHHLIRKEELRKRGLYYYVWDPRLGIPVKSYVHVLHENTGGKNRIPRDVIPEIAWAAAQELGEWATAHIERHHPLREETVYAA